METTKRNWVSPVSGVQKFVPQRYCGDCGDYDDAFTATCRSGSCLVFFDGVIGESGNGDYISDACRGG